MLLTAFYYMKVFEVITLPVTQATLRNLGMLANFAFYLLSYKQKPYLFIKKHSAKNMRLPQKSIN